MKNSVHKLSKNKKIYYIFLSLLVVFLLIVAFLNRAAQEQKSPQDTEDQIVQDEVPLSSKITYVGDYQPEIIQVGVYKQDQASANQLIELQKIVQKLVERYNLEVIDESKENITYISQEHVLFIDLENKEIKFSRINSPESTNIVSQKKAISTAKEFLRLVLPEQNLYPITENIQFFIGSHQLALADPTQATAVEVPFSYLIENFPLYEEGAINPFVLILVNSNLQVQKLEVRASITTPEQVFATTLITLDEALANINQKKDGSFIEYLETDQFLTSAPTLESIRQGMTDSVKIEYRIDSKLNLIYPFYRFEGEFINQENILFNGEIITPAVKIK